MFIDLYALYQLTIMAALDLDRISSLASIMLFIFRVCGESPQLYGAPECPWWDYVLRQRRRGDARRWRQRTTILQASCSRTLLDFPQWSVTGNLEKKIDCNLEGRPSSAVSDPLIWRCQLCYSPVQSTSQWHCSKIKYLSHERKYNMKKLSRKVARKLMSIIRIVYLQNETFTKIFCNHLQNWAFSSACPSRYKKFESAAQPGGEWFPPYCARFIRPKC